MKQSTGIHVLRRIRNLLYWGLEPLDGAVRRLNRMPQYPPIPLRRHVGHLGTMDGPGYEFVAYLKLLAGLKNGARVWDIGCGCGLLELALESACWRGTVIGTDIHGPSVAWAQKHITPRYPSSRFVHSNIYNSAYWPQGTQDAGSWLSEFSEKDFDIIVAKSFFTHLLPEELDIYLNAVSDKLVTGGRALLTFFMLDGETEERMQAGKSAFTFQSPADGAVYAVRRLSAPTAAVAYREEYLRDRFHRAGLAVRGEIQRGYWDGRENGLSFQDLVVLEKGQT